MSLVDVAARLRSERINRVVAAYSEPVVSVKRTALLALTVMWAWFWSQSTNPNSILPAEGIAVLPWVIAMFIMSAIWMALLRSERLKDSVWTDAVGSIANFLGIGILLSVAFNLMLPFVAFLPLGCITIGARYNRKAFLASVAFAVVVVIASAPDGYWVSRPVVGLLALALMIGFPFTVYRLLNALREMSVHAILSRDAQSRFIATMSHELRTPLNTVINAAALIDTNQLSGDQSSLVESLTSNANALLHRVNEVLDVGAIDGGRLQLVTEPFRFLTVIRTVQDVVGPQAKEKGVTLDFAIGVDLGDVLIGDPGRIEQVLTNLTSNAVKFTHAGGAVELSVGKMQDDRSNWASFLCTVKDTGIGIPSEEKSKIFEPFHQVSGGVTRRHGGVGLGLHIVRSVSEQMGGQLSVSDNIGGGSIFTWRISLPRGAPEQLAAEHISVLDALERHRAHVLPLRCLVIEDNAANRDTIGRILVRAGHRMLFAEDGVSGLAAARGSVFDVIFLDLHMPGMSGWDVIDELHKDPGIDNAPPVIVLSAETSPASVTSARQKSVIAYLTKPISAHRLLDALEAISPSRQLAAPPFETASPISMASEISTLETMRQIATGSAVSQYLHSCLEGIEESITALEMALSKGDINAADGHLHSLKNEFHNIAFAPGPLACTQLSERLHSGVDVTVSMSALKRHADQAKTLIRNEPEFGHAI